MASKWSQEELQEAVRDSQSFAGVCRLLGAHPSTGSQTHLSRRIRACGIDTSHFRGQGWNKGGCALNRRSAEHILVARNPDQGRQKAKRLLRALTERGRVYQCALCGNPGLWRDLPLGLEIDHVNNEWWDDREDNLMLLCPNCHSQKPMPT